MIKNGLIMEHIATGCDIIDNYHIEYIVINGEKKKFH